MLVTYTTVTDSAIIFDPDVFDELFNAVKLTDSSSLKALTDHFPLDIMPEAATCSDKFNFLGSEGDLVVRVLELLSASVIIA